MFLSYIIGLPSEPLDLNVTRITFDSCELEWNLPSDIGDESISHYSIIGTPDDISDITEDTMITIMDLMPNTMYTFNVSANNSLGFGDSASVQCTTTGNGKNYKYKIVIVVNHVFISHSSSWFH